MIKVKVEYHQHEIASIVISGHANSSSEMMDVVCAEVSAISVGALNVIDILCPNSCSIVMQSGLVSILVNTSNETLQTILKTVEIQLKTVEQTNSQYIKITKVEV